MSFPNSARYPGMRVSRAGFTVAKRADEDVLQFEANFILTCKDSRGAIAAAAFLSPSRPFRIARDMRSASVARWLSSSVPR